VRYDCDMGTDTAMDAETAATEQMMQANRANWDARTPIHEASAFYALWLGSAAPVIMIVIMKLFGAYSPRGLHDHGTSA
jgi:hypothetical protein